MKILLVIGTRPEAVKMVPVYKALHNCDCCTTRLMLTGQHRNMARGVLELFEVVPDLDLDVMEPGQTLLSLSARLTQALSGVIANDRPDVILVQGDTTSAMIAGWLGFYAGSRVGHVEAGLRTGNLAAPFPEEFNRRVIALTAHWHFAPTKIAAANLRAEGLMRNICIVGNTVIDAALDMAQRHTKGMKNVLVRLPFLVDPQRLTILVTTHRRENFGAPMRDIAAALIDLARAQPTVDFVVPVHLNPTVSAVLRPALQGQTNVHLVAPLEYDELIQVLRHCYLVLTDSGGIQEEAPAFGVPVLVLRNETERTEGVEAGCSQLVGTDRATIVEAVTRLLSDPVLHSRMASARNPYGDGNAARLIAEIVLSAK